jgi:hypothetical protein
MPKYMLIIVDDVDREWDSSEASGEMLGRMGAFAGELGKQGRTHGGGPLTGVDQAARLRQVSGEIVVTDGPFAETKEMVAGYFVIEAADRAEMIELARACPFIEVGAVEIREMIDLGGGPPES